jgi:hypothetical protein
VWDAIFWLQRAVFWSCLVRPPSREEPQGNSSSWQRIALSDDHPPISSSSRPDSTPQRNAAAIPGIKLSENYFRNQPFQTLTTVLTLCLCVAQQILRASWSLLGDTLRANQNKYTTGLSPLVILWLGLNFISKFADSIWRRILMQCYYMVRANMLTALMNPVFCPYSAFMCSVWFYNKQRLFP